MIAALSLSALLVLATSPALAAQAKPGAATSVAAQTKPGAKAPAAGAPARPAAPAPAAQGPPTAAAVDAEFQKLAAARNLWPDFDPLNVPLAIFDGQRTLLFRHPAPPEGFVQDDGAPADAVVFPGRYPDVTANTSARIGGSPTATLRLDGQPATRTARDLAAIAIHEAFHVYQRDEHQGWAGDEAALFTYPIDDARLLGLRRRESEAWRRALGATDPGICACWARRALEVRAERFGGMDPVFGTYERLTELNEGLATYVEKVATGQTTVDIPAAEFGPARVRERAYATGPAIAFLLDRLRPGWQDALLEDDDQTLDGMLQAALAGGAAAAPAGATADHPSGTSCTFTDDEVAQTDRTAEEDIAAEVAARVERRKAFDALPGWRVVVETGVEAPLWPREFDPLNVDRVDGGLLHARFLRLEGDNGDLQFGDEAAADLAALTEGFGPHPLFDGVRLITVAGLAEPEITRRKGQVTLRAPGFTARFDGAKAEVKGTTVRVTWVAKN